MRHIAIIVDYFKLIILLILTLCRSFRYKLELVSKNLRFDFLNRENENDFDENKSR